MTDPVRLEPCPFCGGAAELSGDSDDPNEKPAYLGHWVICTLCGAGTGDGGSYETKALAAKAWNRRAPARDIQPRNAERLVRGLRYRQEYHAADYIEDLEEENAKLRYADAPARDVQPDDARRLDWIARQADEFTSGILVDCPGDGDYFVRGMRNAYGTGRTFRAAIDAAMAPATPREEE